jgi:hypothetical protein
MNKGLIVLLAGLGLLSGCTDEPGYRGLTFVAFNYTPWDIDTIQIIDSDGHTATSGAMGVGGGEGSGTCCYTLNGTEFTVKWRGADGALAQKHMFDGKLDEVIFNKEAHVHFPPTDLPQGKGPLPAAVHVPVFHGGVEL